MLRLRPDAPENGATGGSADNFNTTLSNIQIATPQVTVGYSSSSLEDSREGSSVDSADSSSVGGDQLVMRPGLDDPAAVHHDDPVAGGGLGEAVGDDQPGAPGQSGVGGPVEEPGVGRTGLSGRLIQDRQLRVSQQDASQRDLLRLRRRQLPTGSTHHGVQTLGQQVQ